MGRDDKENQISPQEWWRIWLGKRTSVYLKKTGVFDYYKKLDILIVKMRLFLWLNVAKHLYYLSVVTKIMGSASNSMLNRESLSPTELV